MNRPEPLVVPSPDGADTIPLETREVDGPSPSLPAPRSRCENSAPAEFKNNLWHEIAETDHDAISQPKLLAAVAMFDALCLAGSGIASFALLQNTTSFAWPLVLAIVVLATLVALALQQQGWAYTVAALRQFPRQSTVTLRTIALTLGAIAAADYIIRIDGIPDHWLEFWLLGAAISMLVVKALVARRVRDWARQGRLVRRTVVVGGGRDAEKLIAALESSAGECVRILGIFDDRGDARAPQSLKGYHKLGTFDELVAFCRDTQVDLIVVNLPFAAEGRVLQVLKKLWVLPVDIRLSALETRLRLRSRAYTYVGDVPMLAVFDKPLTDWERVLKNLEDRVIGTLLCFLFAPLMAAVALAVRLDSKGPVFFRQKRYGFNNELIEVYKFRSMYTDMTDRDASKLVTRDDPRVTRVGRFIRRTSLDELPQLFNVVRGELSLVGPRPHALQAKSENALYEDVVDGYFARHRIKPGITGWAQVNGWRGETDTREKIERRVEHDLTYIDRWSVLFDLYILAITPFALMKGENAY